MPKYKAALYTGSFDPITHGHLDLIGRAAATFKQVYVGIGVNPSKKYLFTKEERFRLVKTLVNRWNNVSVVEIPDNRLTADIAYENECVIIKGVRMNADFDYERMLHDISHAHQHGLDTFILPAQPYLGHISSTAAKEVCKLNGNTEDFVSLQVKELMERKLTNQTRVGITGVIGSGKSTITKALIEYIIKNGGRAHDIDIDRIAADILFTRTEPVYQTLRVELQDLLEIPEWSKYHIGSVIFNQENKRIAFNKHLKQPLMTRIRAELQGKEGYIFINCALLVEAGLLPMVNNNVILLDVGEKAQYERLVKRGYDDEQIKRRIQCQLDTKQKLNAINEAHTQNDHGIQTVHRTDLTTPEIIVDKIYNEFLNIYENHI